MKFEKTEYVNIEFSKAELLELIDNAIKAKYPALLDKKVWSLDDFFIEKEITSSSFPDGKSAVFVAFNRVEGPLDKRPDVVYVDIREVCR